MQKGIRLNDGHVASLGLLARKDGTRKGYLSKRSSDNTKWQTKWFALLQNLLFYFESDSSSRPSGLYLLEGCVCDRAPSPKPALSAKEPLEKQHYFTVNFSHENQKALELRTEDAKDCDEWVAAIAHASYRTLATEHEALMQKYLHLLQIVETEKTVAKQLRQQIEDGEIEIERLKAEIASLLKNKDRIQATQTITPIDEDSDIKKIKKVQSFLRGWLCRRKWKTIIQDYIRSPHADSMRKRNQVVFSMLEAEAEYVQQLHILVNNFLRPLRMAASSKKPPITHDDVSSIFLNSETIMFLHQIFYQGLKARISSWPTLVLADLFDILLPMLNIYQEFVRNHQYSLQILAHCKFSSPPPLSLTKKSSPSRQRKLSLNIPIITGGKALDLAALGCSSNGYTGVYSAMSPFSKAALDTSKLYVSSGFANKIADEGDTATEKPEEPSALSKQSSDVSVREESDTDPNQSDDADTETSPSKSPTTPKSVKSKNSSEFPLFSYNNGVVKTSCRELENSRSSLSAASAFAIATAGANEGTPSKEKYRRMSLATAGFPSDQRHGDKEFVIRRAATNRVLNVLRHWVSKHSQDFESNKKLKRKVISFLEEVMRDPELLSQERKAAGNIVRTLTQEDPGDNQITLEEVMQMAAGVKAEPFENHSALEIAEQLTLLDHLVFRKIPYEEFFGQGWMKLEKNERTPYIMKTTKHFNDISNLIASEIIRSEDIGARVSAIEKWVAVADICRCLHNYNAVLEITSSMNRSAIFRLKKTWLKVSKQTKALIDKLQKLVSSEGRFKNLREALKNCDPPCVPYLGMYLTDLAFIEEGTPNYTEDGLVNFSKMRMISHIIREIRQFQQTAYKIEHQAKVTQYLLDQSFVMDEESLYESSLRLEPKLPT
ncbi:Ras protein specific guanine nucleotide releasing factor 1 [Phyllostomus discolor]|uniref:Ras protein specific guanine nucleotide releasing factor 1 n=1 Tax=Phyllostomus discolor TaxID=89673 RepID=A0A834DFT9_9CHIR|nr:Ras protein specific guanine nucleotide releasing factor 1 [Phyllostomus discolor]